MIQPILGYIAYAAVFLILCIAAGIALYFIKSKLGEDNFALVIKWVNIAVKAAEQTITGTGKGAEKKAWVVNFLTELGYDVDDGVDAVIEATVKDMNTGS
jgi:uncharacterized protein (UPF0333 family)